MKFFTPTHKREQRHERKGSKCVRECHTENRHKASSKFSRVRNFFTPNKSTNLSPESFKYRAHRQQKAAEKKAQKKQTPIRALFASPFSHFGGKKKNRTQGKQAPTVSTQVLRFERVENPEDVRREREMRRLETERIIQIATAEAERLLRRSDPEADVGPALPQDELSCSGDSMYDTTSSSLATAPAAPLKKSQCSTPVVAEAADVQSSPASSSVRSKIQVFEQLFGGSDLVSCTHSATKQSANAARSLAPRRRQTMAPSWKADEESFSNRAISPKRRRNTIAPEPCHSGSPEAEIETNCGSFLQRLAIFEPAKANQRQRSRSVEDLEERRLSKHITTTLTRPRRMSDEDRQARREAIRMRVKNRIRTRSISD